MAGNAESLIAWFNDGADGAISWGEEGSFTACVGVAGDHMDDDMAKGFCANRYHDATGDWPGRRKENAVASLEERIEILEQAVKGLATLTTGVT